MSEFLTAHESLFRFAVFAGLLALFAGAEAVWPRRVRAMGRWRRWFTNLAMLALSSLLLRAAFPILAAGVALWAQQNGIGLFNIVAVPAWLAFAGSMVLLDLVIWAQHWAFHLAPPLWRIHRTHHADRDVDATTAVRFHPFEIALSMGLKMGVVLAIGPPAAAVILFETLLNGSALFHHSNLRLPAGLDRVLRWVIVTPDMHRIHHSVRREEHDSNFGFGLTLWDRLFGTYRAMPRDGHDGMTIGLTPWQDARPAGLWWTLAVPFARREAAVRTPRDSG
jgi:sterol desaturase/sphingolipid hydroxylase (fatty acid hydroxylase superfamily)